MLKTLILLLIFILLLYILFHQFFVYKNVSDCKKLTGHLKKIDEVTYKSTISSYNPSFFIKNDEINIGVRECTAGSKIYNLDSFLNISNLKILDKNLNVKTKIKAKFHNDIIRDVRIFNYNNKYVGIASIGVKIPRPIILYFNNDLTNIDSTHFLESEETRNNIPAKNWILINDNLIHTDTYPEFKVQEIKNFKLTSKFSSKDEMKKISEKFLLFNTKVTKFHGGCNWINLRNGNYLTVVHTFVSNYSVKKLRRIYRHMFIEVDSSTFKIVKHSDWICFSEKCECIQFVSTMIKIDGVIKIGMGINDSYTKIVDYNEQDICDRLKYV